MGFGNYGICDLWDFGIMGEGGEEGRNRERKVGQEPWSIRAERSHHLKAQESSVFGDVWEEDE